MYTHISCKGRRKKKRRSIKPGAGRSRGSKGLDGARKINLYWNFKYF